MMVNINSKGQIKIGIKYLNLIRKAYESITKCVLVIIVGIVFCSCAGNGSNNTNSSQTNQIPPKIQTKISSIEDAKNYINGKTFIGTPSGSIWYKLVFSGGNASVWKALPQDGRWGSNADLSVSYEVKQARYVDTGQTYYYVILGTSEDIFNYFNFDITAKVLYLSGKDTGTDMQEGDRNPWD